MKIYSSLQEIAKDKNLKPGDTALLSRDYRGHTYKSSNLFNHCKTVVISK